MIIGKLITNKYIMNEDKKQIKTCSSSLKKMTSEFKVYLYTIVYYYYFLNLFH